MATAPTLIDRFSGWALARRVGGFLTGSYDDLRRLVAAPKKRPPRHSFGLMTLVKALERDIETQSGIAALFARVGRQVNPRAKHKLLRNLIYNWAAIGARRRNELADAGNGCRASS